MGVSRTQGTLRTGGFVKGSKFPINQLYDDMWKVPVQALRETNIGKAAEYYGLDVETVNHWIRIIIGEKSC